MVERVLAFDWRWVCRRLSRNISIHNRYCNRFINPGRPMFFVNNSGASAATVFTIPINFGIAHARCYTHAVRVAQSATQVGSSLLDALTVPSNHYVPKIVIIVSPICRCCTSSIVIYLITVKGLIFLSIGHQKNPPFLLLWSDDCAMDRGTCAMTFAFHVIHKICHIKYSLQFISTFWCRGRFSQEELGNVAAF